MLEGATGRSSIGSSSSRGAAMDGEGPPHFYSAKAEDAPEAGKQAGGRAGGNDLTKDLPAGNAALCFAASAVFFA